MARVVSTDGLHCLQVPANTSRSRNKKGLHSRSETAWPAQHTRPAWGSCCKLCGRGARDWQCISCSALPVTACAKLWEPPRVLHARSRSHCVRTVRWRPSMGRPCGDEALPCRSSCDDMLICRSSCLTCHRAPRHQTQRQAQVTPTGRQAGQLPQPALLYAPSSARTLQIACRAQSRGDTNNSKGAVQC